MHTGTHTKTTITMTFSSYAFGKAELKFLFLKTYHLFSTNYSAAIRDSNTFIHWWKSMGRYHRWKTVDDNAALIITLQDFASDKCGKATRKLLKRMKPEPDKETREEIDWCTDRCIGDVRVQAMCGVHNVPVHLTIWKGNARLEGFDNMWSEKCGKPLFFFQRCHGS